MNGVDLYSLGQGVGRGGAGGRGRQTCTAEIPKRLATSTGSRKNPSIKTVTREALAPCAERSERSILWKKGVR